MADTDTPSPAALTISERKLVATQEPAAEVELASPSASAQAAKKAGAAPTGTAAELGYHPLPRLVFAMVFTVSETRFPRQSTII
jgi:hypothetical protein